MDNPWKVLGVHRQTPLHEVRLAFLSLIKKCHPDVSRKAGGYSKTVELNAAYNILKNSARLRNFITHLMVTHKNCEGCKGAGAVFKQKSLTNRTASVCKTCEGSGFVLKKGKKDGDILHG